MLLIHSKSSTKYRDLRLHLRKIRSPWFTTSIDNAGRHGKRGYRLKVNSPDAY